MQLITNPLPTKGPEGEILNAAYSTLESALVDYSAQLKKAEEEEDHAHRLYLAAVAKRQAADATVATVKQVAITYPCISLR